MSASRRLLRVLAVAFLGAVSGAAWIVFFYAAAPGLSLDMDRPLPPLVRGFYPVERAPDGLTFAWTGAQADIGLPGLDRRSPWEVAVRFRGARPDPRELPEVQITIDGVNVARARATNTFRELRAELPAQQGHSRGAHIQLVSSTTFVPGPGDARSLGLQVDWIVVRPVGRNVVLAPRVVLGGAMLGGATMSAAIAMTGITAATAVGAGVLLSAAQAAALARDVGPYTPFARTFPFIAAFIAVALVAGTWAAEVRSGTPLRNTARFVAVFVAGALYLKLLVLLHPAMPVGDALFQAHRFEDVLGGHLFFTSDAPGGYQFPYAIWLYIVAAPFSLFTSGPAGHMALLRILVAVMDAVAGLLVYGLLVRGTGDRVAGAIGAGLFQLIPLDFGVQAVGNLTNAFGQSWFVVALAAIGSGWLVPRTRSRVIVIALSVLFAFLSHTSTFAILTVVLLCTVAAFSRAGAVLHGAGRTLALVTGAAFVLAVLMYYGYFWDTYRDQAARILGEMGRPAAASDPAGRSIGGRAWAVPAYLRAYFGLPAVVLASIGAWRLLTAWRREAFTLMLGAWTAGCALFLVLGVLTPVDMRYYLAFYPALAILGGIGAAWLWREGTPGRGVAVALLAWAAWTGVEGWIAPLA